jgi:glycerophosphoryl diester phosphodiesterase
MAWTMLGGGNRSRPQRTLLLAIGLACSAMQGLAQGHHPLIIAHRGASSAAPENTLAAFREAMRQGSDALELDVRRTRDGKLIVLHDESIDRTTTSSGKASQLSADRLASADAGIKFHPSFAGEHIPALEEVLALLDSTTLVVIELKEDSSSSPGIERQLVDAVRESGHVRQVLLKSFQPSVLHTLAVLAPNIPRIFVYAIRVPWLNLIIGSGISTGSVFDVPAQYLQPHWYMLSESFVREAQARGFKVIAWGVDGENELREAVKYGLDGIETDTPGELRKILRGR